MKSQLVRSARRSRRATNRSRGFTLVEVMVVLFVLGMLILIFAGSVVMAQKSAHINGDFAQALSLCQHKIDQCRAAGYGRLNYAELDPTNEIIDDTPTSSPYSFVNVDQVATYLPSPTATLTITTFGTGKAALVTATVTWKKTNNRNKTCTVSISAIIANII